MSRQKMPRINRAKQFAPFDALKGLKEALKQKEIKVEQTKKSQLYAQQVEMINNVLVNLKPKQNYLITFYNGNCYESISGNVICNKQKKCVLCKNKEISFFDIYSIEEC